MTRSRRPTPERLALAAEVKRLRGLDPRPSWTEIGDRLGISPSWAADLYRDPDGSLAPQRPSRQKQPCSECGQPRSPDAERCAACAAAHRTAENIAAIRKAIEGGAVTIPQIAAATHRKPDSVRRLLADLVEWGIVTRQRSIGYRKRWIYSLRYDGSVKREREALQQ